MLGGCAAPHRAVGAQPVCIPLQAPSASTTGGVAQPLFFSPGTQTGKPGATVPAGSWGGGSACSMADTEVIKSMRDFAFNLFPRF